MKMSFLKVLGYDRKTDSIEFELNNHEKDFIVDASVPNALRRTMLNGIPNIKIDSESIEYKKNTSMLHDDFLSLRLELLPFNTKSLAKHDITSLRMTVNVKNDSDDIISIYMRDFVITNIDTKITLKDIYPFPDILFAKLDRGQTLNISCKFKEGTVLTDGARMTHALATYHYKQDVKEVAAAVKDLKMDAKTVKRFRTSTADLVYEKTKKGLVRTYVFKLESLGSLSVRSIFMEAVRVLDEGISIIEDAIKDGDLEKISTEKSSIAKISYDFHLTDEDETLGNLIASQLYYDKRVDYAAYVMPHPLDRVVIIRMSLYSDNTLTNNVKAFVNILGKIRGFLKLLNSEWKTKVRSS